MTEAINIITPKVTVKYSSLDKPGQYKDYYCVCILDPNNEEHSKFLKTMKVYVDEHKATIKKKTQFNLFIKKEEDSEGTPTGNFLIKGKSKFSVVMKDGKNQTIANPISVPPGSTVRMALKVSPYDKGVTSYLQAVKIIQLSDGMDVDFPEDEDGQDLSGEVTTGPQFDADDSDGDF